MTKGTSKNNRMQSIIQNTTGGKILPETLIPLSLCSKKFCYSTFRKQFRRYNNYWVNSSQARGKVALNDRTWTHSLSPSEELLLITFDESVLSYFVFLASENRLTTFWGRFCQYLVVNQILTNPCLF